MPHVEKLSLVSLYIYVFVLRYLVWREQQFEMLMKRAHWLAQPAASFMFPERKKYKINILSYSIYLWLSVDSKQDHAV